VRPQVWREVETEAARVAEARGARDVTVKREE
jgi:hypothetical protein